MGLKKVIKIYHFLNLIIEIFIKTLLVLMTMIICYRVFMRFVFNITPSWSEELTCLMVVWVTCLGMGIGVREKMHIGITVLFDKFSKNVQIWLDRINNAVMFALGLYVFLYHGILICNVMKFSKLAIVKLPNSILYLVVPILGVQIMIYTLIHIFDKNGLFTLKQTD